VATSVGMHNQLNQFSFELSVAAVILAYFGRLLQKKIEDFFIVPLPKGVLEKLKQ
jgi:hypothetical protein